MSDDTSRLAVLIDADNISAKVAKDMFEELAGYGTLTVKRAYGDWTHAHLTGWKEQLHALRDLADAAVRLHRAARTPPTRR